MLAWWAYFTHPALDTSTIANKSSIGLHAILHQIHTDCTANLENRR